MMKRKVKLAKSSALNALPDFRRAAWQRLEAAEMLSDKGLELDAMYLSGYVAECALKAVLVKRTPQRSRYLLLKKFRGQQGHSLDFLKNELERCRAILPENVNAALRRLATWSTDLRYKAGKRRKEDAILFLTSARAIVDWAERML
jgi:HEPN domain-containing protein